jgi:hypothetical protein
MRRFGSTVERDHPADVRAMPGGLEAHVSYWRVMLVIVSTSSSQ